MTTKAFRAALFINSFNVPTPLEWLVLGCIGVFASFTLIHFSPRSRLISAPIFDFLKNKPRLLSPTTVFNFFGHPPTTDRAYD